jgi:hypothetical protein
MLAAFPDLEIVGFRQTPCFRATEAGGRSFRCLEQDLEHIAKSDR